MKLGSERERGNGEGVRIEERLRVSGREGENLREGEGGGNASCVLARREEGNRK